MLAIYLQFHVLYIVAFVIVMLGVAIYSARPVGNASQEPEALSQLQERAQPR